MTEKKREAFIAIFDGENRAVEVQQQLKKLLGIGTMIYVMDQEGLVSFHGPAITYMGIMLGVMAGGIIGLMLGEPLIGLVLGGIVGVLGIPRLTALRKTRLDSGEDKKIGGFSNKALAKLMSPGSSAITATIKPEQIEEVVAALKEHGPRTVVHAPEGKMGEKIDAGIEAGAEATEEDNGQSPRGDI